MSSNRDAFVAIADPTRRKILELLRDRGRQTAGEIAGNFKSASRPGISRHLRVLRECDVVVCSRQGKTQNYDLNSATLVAIREGWLSGFSKMQTDSLSALRERVEKKK